MRERERERKREFVSDRRRPAKKFLMPSAYQRRRRKKKKKKKRNRSSALGAWLFDFKILWLFFFYLSGFALAFIMRFSLAFPSLIFCCYSSFYIYILFFCGRPRHVSRTMKYCDDIAIRLVLLIGSRLSSTSSPFFLSFSLFLSLSLLVCCVIYSITQRIHSGSICFSFTRKQPENKRL